MVARFSSLGIPHHRFPPFSPVGPSPHQQQSSSWDFSPILMAPASSHRGHQWICDLVRGSCLLLLLVVSNLLLCQGVEDYAPYCKNQPGNCRIPLQSLFERATLVASNNYRLAREMFNEFDEALFRLVISLLHSWDEPLHQAVTELLHRNGASPDILARAKEIEDKAKVLLEGVEMIQKRVHPGEKKNEPYPVWSEKSSLTADDEDVRQTAFYRMFHCLHRDSSKISTYINLLKCRFTPC
nr:PREDICTED: chorionic somatomammotropin hormone 1 isoform X2 [Bos mutus]